MEEHQGDSLRFWPAKALKIEPKRLAALQPWSLIYGLLSPVSPCPLGGYLLLTVSPQLKYHFPKKAFPDPTGQTGCASTHSHKVLLLRNSSHMLSLHAIGVVLIRGQFCLPGDMCLCLETHFVITTGGGANTLNRSGMLLNILQHTA